MAETTSRSTIEGVRAWGFGAAALALSLLCVQARASAQEEPTIRLQDFGIVPRPAVVEALLRFSAVQDELKITPAQRKEQDGIQKRGLERFQQARAEMKDRAKFVAARTAIFNEITKARLANLKPEQRERLAQIQLQAQGPLAFSIQEPGESSDGFDRGEFLNPRLSERLGLSQDQVKRVRTIAEEGIAQIEKAAAFQLPWDFKEKPTAESIRKRVEGPEFRALKAKTRRTAHDVWNATIRRIEAIFSDEQRTGYRRILGAPFDFAKLQLEENASDAASDLQAVARALGLGGQRADPSFDVTVARPAFTTWHPTAAIDEAHDNFHTAVGRYKPFADLMANDGFLIARNTKAFNSKTLERYQVLVIANATAAGARGRTGAAGSAFTEDECSAIQRWVWDGGALLLITDHEPYGSASQALAQRFGVVMNTSGTTDPDNEDAKNGGLIFTRESQLVVDHPITNGRDPSERINRVETFYGQALIGPVGSTAFLRFADTATYESTNGMLSAAGWAQGVALGYGAGRVVVMGEAAELSAQLAGLEPMGMNAPGIDNRLMALNIMRWLSGNLEPRDSAEVERVACPVSRRWRLAPGLFSRTDAGRRRWRAAGVAGE